MRSTPQFSAGSVPAGSPQAGEPRGSLAAQATAGGNTDGETEQTLLHDLAARANTIETALRSSVPPATARAMPMEMMQPSASMPLLANFQEIARQRDARLASPSAVNRQTLDLVVHRTSQSELATTSGMQNFTDTATLARTLPEFEGIRLQMMDRQSGRPSREQPRETTPEPPTWGPFDDDESQETPRHYEGDETQCSVCMDQFARGDRVARLVCRHIFHCDCLERQIAQDLRAHRQLTCANCRGLARVTATWTYIPVQQHTISTPASSFATAGSPDHDASEQAVPLDMEFDGVPPFPSFPWWPASDTEAIAPYYHASTQVPDRLTMIVDSGAWTNLMGLHLARMLTRKALENGNQPKQVKMKRPLAIEGVGDGAQKCNWQLESPIAFRHEGDGVGHLHEIEAPIVEGSGAGLPGLLGCRTMEKHNAIHDMGKRQLHFPGPGEVQIILPPGSVTVDLIKAPSGHQTIPIDEFAAVPPRTGGLPEQALQLHAASSASASTAMSSAETPPDTLATAEKTFGI